MRPLRPPEPKQAPDVEKLRRRWRTAIDAWKRSATPETAAAERAAWHAYRDAAWPADPREPLP